MFFILFYFTNVRFTLVSIILNYDWEMFLIIICFGLKRMYNNSKKRKLFFALVLLLIEGSD